jgi:starch synthase
MANPTRILFVSDEVAPFTDSTDTAQLVRCLPELLQESGEYEVRILMPRYGTISERRNRLHEVIRLSGTEVTIGEQTETLKCKVASIPGIRLQVYFMDNRHYFKRKGIYRDKQGRLFEDNAERALFFGRAALETIRNLGWKPDVVHGFGWMSGLVPLLLRSTYAADELYQDVRVVYTPNVSGLDAPVTQDLLAAGDVSAPVDVAGLEPSEIGCRLADALILPSSHGQQNGTAIFSEDQGDWMAQVADLYALPVNELAA